MLTVRSMCLSDIEDIYRIERAAHLVPWPKTVLQKCVLINYDCFVLEQTESKPAIVGYIIVHRIDILCHILNVCIDKAYQHQGLGAFLLQHYLDSLKNTSIRYINLEVRPSNYPAIQMYQKFQFIQIDVKKDYYNEGIKEDALVFQKLINFEAIAYKI